MPRIRQGFLLPALCACAAAMALAVPPAALAQEPLPPQLPPEIEDRAKSLDKQFICPVCPGETLDQAQATLAKQMREIIRQRLLNGESGAQISDYFVSVYGESVLAAPPKEGFNLIAWIVPILAVVAGAAIVVLVVRAMRRNAPALPDGESYSEDELEEYLAIVDREMEGALGMDRPAEVEAGTAPERDVG